jgi:diguanylate cyclase (GGDEF)-like protein
MAQVLVMLGVVFVAVVCLTAVSVAAWTLWRRGATELQQPLTVPVSEAGTREVRPGSPQMVPTTPHPELYDRVVRVLALLFLAAVGVVVFVSRAYPDTEVAIQLLIAAGILAVVFIQDLLPVERFQRARRWLEAVASVAFVAILVGLTGGLRSPFFPGFFLVVGGASLSLEEAAPLLLALLAAGGYAVVGIAVAPLDQVDASTLVWLGFNVATLVLLAYLASVVGREQRQAREAAIRLSRFDPLTGLYNRNYFFSVMDRELHRAARSGNSFAVLMLDLDDLKPVNDTFGHLQGDDLLRSVTALVQRDVRITDVAARYGGDEFVVLLPDTDARGAMVVAEKLRSDVAGLHVAVGSRTIRVTSSIGLVSYPDDGSTIDGLINAVDAAMYEAKRRGKNQVMAYTTRTERVPTPVAVSRPAFARTPPREEPAPPTAVRERTSTQPRAVPDMGGRQAPPEARPTEPRRPAWDSTAPTEAPAPTGPAVGRSEGQPAAPPRTYVALPVERERAVGRRGPRESVSEPHDDEPGGA